MTAPRANECFGVSTCATVSPRKQLGNLGFPSCGSSRKDRFSHGYHCDDDAVSAVSRCACESLDLSGTDRTSVFLL